MRNGRGAFSVVGAVTLLYVATVGCGSRVSDAATTLERPPTPVHVDTVTAQAYEDTLVLPGLVEPETRIALGFRIDGFVARFDVDEGDRVEAGTVIAELDLADLDRDARLAQAALDRATAQAAEAELVFERQQDLHASRNTSQQAFDQARLAWEAARAETANAALQLEAAQDRLSKGTLRAPIAGHIERKLLEAHEPARAGQRVVTLTVLDPIKVRATVADTAIGRLRIGHPVSVHSAAWPDRTFTGTISRIDIAADAATRTRPFEVTLPNPDLALRPESVVDVQVTTGHTEAVHMVPLAAVLRDVAAEPFCFVIGDTEAQPRAVRRPVALGPVRGARVTIVRGLTDGDRVVVRGQHYLGDGDRVRITTE